VDILTIQDDNTVLPSHINIQLLCDTALYPRRTILISVLQQLLTGYDPDVM